MSRILIAGGPRVGKTTLAASMAAEHGIAPRSSDDVIGLGWSEASAEVATWFAQAGPWVIEGVAVPRAVRKWLAANAGAPCDVVYWSAEARVARTYGQEAMAKGCASVWAEVLPELLRRGVKARTF